MNLRLLIVAVLLPLVSFGAEPMESPFRPRSFQDALRLMKEVGETLPENDRLFFTAGFERLDIAFTQYLPAELKQEEREAAFVAAVTGLTPRQIILLGMTFFSQQVAIDTAREKRLPGRTQELDWIVQVQRLYIPKASQALEPTPSSVTLLAEQEKRRP